jgi:hypothetical protein
MKLLFDILVLFPTSSSAWAETGRYCCSPQFAFQRLLQKIALAKGPENRFVYPEFKAQNKLTDTQFKMLTSGDGAFSCGLEGGGASLILRPDLIVTVAHIFLKFDQQGKCLGRKPDVEIKQCQFRKIDVDGKLGGHPYQIDLSTLRTGDQCKKPDLIANDWAVVELKEGEKIITGRPWT